jgi:hypothetical protein
MALSCVFMKLIQVQLGNSNLHRRECHLLYLLLSAFLATAVLCFKDENCCLKFLWLKFPFYCFWDSRDVKLRNISHRPKLLHSSLSTCADIHLQCESVWRDSTSCAQRSLRLEKQKRCYLKLCMISSPLGWLHFILHTVSVGCFTTRQWSEHLASNGGVTDEWWIENGLGKSGRGFIEVLSWNFLGGTE